MPFTTREWHFVKRPSGLPTAATYRLVERELPELQPDQYLVRNLVLSVDPYMRPRMDDQPSCVAPYRLGEALSGGAIGEVIESRTDADPEGSWIIHQSRWREHAVLEARSGFIIDEAPLSEFLPPRGPGDVQLHRIRRTLPLRGLAGWRRGFRLWCGGRGGQHGRTVHVARRRESGGRKRGLTGEDGPPRCRSGIRCCVQRRDAPVLSQLRSAFPSGFEVYFDNVGSDHLTAALEVINDFGRVVVCGTISTYNAGDHRATIGDTFKIVAKRIRLQGFIVSDHEDLRSEFTDRV